MQAVIHMSFIPFLVSAYVCPVWVQIVYILDQVKALEREILKRFEDQGVEVEVQIVIVTRLIPEAQVCSDMRFLQAADPSAELAAACPSQHLRPDFPQALKTVLTGTVQPIDVNACALAILHDCKAGMRSARLQLALSSVAYWLAHLQMPDGHLPALLRSICAAQIRDDRRLASVISLKQAKPRHAEVVIGHCNLHVPQA